MNGTILIVDDESGTRDLLKEVFDEVGYSVRLADGSGQALEVLLQEDMDVIFLDLRLFGMNGIELCREIRKTKPMSIIYAMTGWSGLFEIEECREAGFDDYFMKPLSIDQLCRAVEEGLEKRRRWLKRRDVL